MDIILNKPRLGGSVRVPESKSMLHRMLICAALSDAPTDVECNNVSEDISATMNCLCALGAVIERTEGVIRVYPQNEPKRKAVCNASESGSTLRFLMPVTAALGADAVFSVGETLARRPLYPLDRVMEEHGVGIQTDNHTVCLNGRLCGDSFTIDGGVSSQFISGLMLSSPLMGEKTTIEITGCVSSAQYIAMTAECMRLFGCECTAEQNGRRITVSGGYRSPGRVSPGGDRTNGAVWLVCGALSDEPVTAVGVDYSEYSGDGIIVPLLKAAGAEVIEEKNRITVRKSASLNRPRAFSVDADAIPDLVPILCVLASVCDGTSVISNCGRLRLKESDRIASTVGMLSSLGADIRAEADDIVVRGRESLCGGCAETYSDHRIAMAASAASLVCTGPVTVTGCECVGKSYPSFFEDFSALIRNTGDRP